MAMRYWAYFAAKLAAAGVAFYGLLLLLDRVIPSEARYAVSPGEKDIHKLLAPLEDMGLKLGTYAALMVCSALATAAVFFIVRDQRYRCRVCLRRLRMPVVTGSWSRMLLLGRPRVEYICPYGHGTLRADEVQISGLANPEWTPQSGDMWEDLYASSHHDDRE
jgi:hypothetical protein